MATITLDYFVSSASNISDAKLRDKVEAVDLFSGELDLLNMSVFADLTALSPGGVLRSVVLLTDAVSDELFPNDADKIAATKNLYRQTLAYGIPSKVEAADPIVVP